MCLDFNTHQLVNLPHQWPRWNWDCVSASKSHLVGKESMEGAVELKEAWFYECLFPTKYGVAILAVDIRVFLALFLLEKAYILKLNVPGTRTEPGDFTLQKRACSVWVSLMATSSGKCSSFCRASSSAEYTVHCSISGRNAICLRPKSARDGRKMTNLIFGLALFRSVLFWRTAAWRVPNIQQHFFLQPSSQVAKNDFQLGKLCDICPEKVGPLALNLTSVINQQSIVLPPPP